MISRMTQLIMEAQVDKLQTTSALVGENGEHAESEKARHQSCDSGTNSTEKDEDITGELERNLEQVSDTHMIDLEPLQSGASNEKLLIQRRKKGNIDSDVAKENLKQVLKPSKRKGNVNSDPLNNNLKQAPKPKKRKGNLDCDAPNKNLKQSPKPKKSKDIVQGADPEEKVRKPDKGNATEVVTLRKSSRLATN
ncbi:hypothetical protein QYF36_000155 [Acer negundo]|nr:hypothetical protein QYF36_000155 [Acer negundo]